jgi:hypothetical protein
LGKQNFSGSPTMSWAQTKLVFFVFLLLPGLYFPVEGQELEDLPQIDWYQPSNRYPRGEELVMVYFGGASCAPCQNPKLKNALRHAQLLLKGQAEDSGTSFASVGVAVDWRPDVGARWLGTVANFDEISAGRSWSNSDVTHWLVERDDVEPIRPAVVVYRRKADYRAGASEYGGKVLLKSFGGGDEIISWVKAGAPVG